MNNELIAFLSKYISLSEEDIEVVGRGYYSINLPAIWGLPHRHWYPTKNMTEKYRMKATVVVADTQYNLEFN